MHPWNKLRTAPNRWTRVRRRPAPPCTWMYVATDWNPAPTSESAAASAYIITRQPPKQRTDKYLNCTCRRRRESHSDRRRQVHFVRRIRLRHRHRAAHCTHNTTQRHAAKPTLMKVLNTSSDSWQAVSADCGSCWHKQVSELARSKQEQVRRVPVAAAAAFWRDIHPRLE